MDKVLGRRIRISDVHRVMLGYTSVWDPDSQIPRVRSTQYAWGQLTREAALCRACSEGRAVPAVGSWRTLFCVAFTNKARVGQGVHTKTHATLILFIFSSGSMRRQPE
jgi:hypothetical protein